MRRLLTILMAMALMLSLVACGGESKNTPAPSGNLSEPEKSPEVSEPTPSVTPTPELPSKEIIEEELQGAWLGEIKGANSDEVVSENYFIFDNGVLTTKMIIGGVDGPINEGTYSIDDWTIIVNEGTFEYTYDNDEFVLFDSNVMGELKRVEMPDLTSDVWKSLYYDDEFGQPTDEGFVTTDRYVEGKFSNSATTDSKLYVAFIADLEYLAIQMLEYGNNTVMNSSSRYDEAYDITMRIEDDTRHQITGVIWTGGDRIVIDDSYTDLVVEALSATGSVDFYIVQRDRPTTTYLFTLETADFADEYQSLSN